MTAWSGPGMGCILRPGGAGFRVWAPNASSVAVAGDFNDWSTKADPLTAEGDGNWSADVDGVRPGQQYRYVITSGGVELPWRPDPYGQSMDSSIGNTVVYADDFDWGPAIFPQPARDELVVYELHIGTYNDRPGGGPGRISDVVDHLDHLVELGVTAIELLPPAEFPGGFSWGYNPSSIFTVETDYGGPQALKQLIRAAHDRGLAVLCDVVYNHFGSGDAAVWRFDGWHEGDHGGIYLYADRRDVTPWGHTRPDYGRPEVRRYLRDNALTWLEQFRFDGLRWDATNYIRNIDGGGDPRADIADGWALMAQINDAIADRQPWKVSIAEDMQNNEWVTRPTRDGGAGFTSQWDADFHHTVRGVLVQPRDEDRDVGALRTAIERRWNGDALHRVIFTESHDEVGRLNGKRRLPEDIHPGNAGGWYARKRSTLGAALALTVPGIPMLFQGQEFLEDGAWHDDDPLDWTKAGAYAGIVQLYRDLIALRRDRRHETAGLRGPHVTVHHVNAADKVLAYHRYAAGGPRDSVIVLLNLANRSYPSYLVGVPREGRWQVRFNSDWAGYDATFGNHPAFAADARWPGRDGMPFTVDVGLGPYTAVILSQND